MGETMKENPVHSVCGGIGIPMGTLGNLEWFRCQDCGLDFSRKIKRKKSKKKVSQL